MKFILTLLTCLFLGAALQAQETDSFGAAAGASIGSGLSYRHWPGPWGFQVTGLPIINASSVYVVVGAQALYNLHETKNTRLFAWGGGSAAWENRGPTVGAGGGFGLELIAWDHLVFTLQPGLGAEVGAGGPTAGLRVQSGIFYRL